MHCRALSLLYCDTDSSAAYTSIFIRGPTKSDFRYRYIATKIPYRPGIPSTILYYRSRKYARINIDVYVAELSVSQYKKCMKELAINPYYMYECNYV